MKLTYLDLEDGHEHVREGETDRVVNEDLQETVVQRDRLRSVSFNGEPQVTRGVTYFELIINDNYPLDVVECTDFRIDSGE